MEKSVFKKYNVLFSILIFCFFAALIFFEKEKSYLFYPFLSLSLIPLTIKNYEIRFLIMFVGSVLVFFTTQFSLMPKQGLYFISIIELFSFWGFAYIVYKFSENERKEMEMTESEISRNLYELKNIHNDMEAYKRHIEKLKRQVEIKKALSEMIRVLPQMNNIDEIKDKMKGFLVSSFEDLDVEIVSEFGHENLFSFIVNSKMPLLVKNVSTDLRFKRNFFKAEEKSVIAVPIIVSGIVSAVIKISSKKPDRLGEEELRILELMATSASISMENIILLKKVTELAIKDPLTGLYTHKYFQEKLEDEILRSARMKIPFSLIIADIDHFKRINDTYGHQVGDMVLKKVAELFSSAIRDVDCLARYGGEEFSFILPGINKMKALELAEFLRKAMTDLILPGLKERFSASFGISEFPLEAISKSQLIRLSDERLYKAKNSGRNKCVYE